MKALKRARIFFDKTNNVFMGVACVIVIADAIAVSVDTMMRYFLRESAIGIFELTEYSLVWMTFLGATWLLQKDGHIRMDVIVTRLNQRLQTVINIVVYGVCTILLAVVTFFSIKLIVYYYQTNYFFQTVLEPRRWAIELIVPIGCFMLFIQLLIKTYGYMAKWKASSKGGQTPVKSPSGG